MLNHFTFNGHSTGELGLLVSGINIYGSPSRIVEKVTIPYRSGDLIIDTGAYTNYMLTYTVDIMDNTKATAEAISKWLLGSKGYCELTDTYNPEIYRVASYYNQLDYTLSALYRYGKATITFDCKPQKYLTANQPVTLTPTTSEATSYSLSSPAMPLPLTLEGNTTQGTDPTPEAPQEIHSVSGDNEIRVVGKNLFNFNQWANDIGMMRGTKTVSSNSITLTATSNDCYTVYGYDSKLVPIVVQPNTTYTLTWKANNNNDGILYLFDGTDRNHALVNANNKTTKSVTFNTGSSTSIAYRFGVLYSGQSITYYDIQLEKGTATTFEPYKAQVYPITLPVQNYLRPNFNSQTINGVTITKNADGTITCNGTATATVVMDIDQDTPLTVGKSYFLSGCPVGGNINTHFKLDFQDTSYHTDMGSGASINSYSPNADSSFDNKTRLVIYTGEVCKNLVFKPMIREAEITKASYTPYGVASIELNALSSFKDYIHKTDGKWYLHKATGYRLLKGTEPWTIATNDPNAYFYIGLGTEVPSTNYFPLISDRFTAVEASGRATEGSIWGMYTQIHVHAPSSIAPSGISSAGISEFKTWLTTHNTEVIYALATPTETEITDATLISQLNALSKAKTYDGATNIVQDGNDAEFTFKLPVPAEISSEYFGEPIITVNEVGTIVWNDSLIKVNSAPVTINSQTLQCYYYSENKNNDVEINDFPKYEQGDNYIGSTMALTVVPNYWKL